MRIQQNELIIPDEALDMLAPMADPPLSKATIETPKGKDGKVDYDKVPVGASIWVTVTNPSSPMHGRPIMITKRPDKKFALTGGAGWGHYDPADTSKGNQRTGAQRARKHLVMEGVGNKERIETDEKKTELSDKRKAIKQAQNEKRSQREEAAKNLLDVAGYDLDSADSKAKLQELKTSLVEQAAGAGLTETQTKKLLSAALGEAKKIQKRIAIQRAEMESLATLDAHIKGNDAIADDHQALLDAIPTPESVFETPILTPEFIESLVDKSPEEIEQAVKETAQQHEESLFDQAEEKAQEKTEIAPELPQEPESPQNSDVESDTPAPESPQDGLQQASDPSEEGPTEPESQNEPESPAEEEKQPEPESDAPAADDSAESDRRAKEEEKKAARKAKADAKAEEARRAEEERQAEEDRITAENEAKQAKQKRVNELLGAFTKYHEVHQTQRVDEKTVKTLRRAVALDSQTVENLRQEVEDVPDADIDGLLRSYAAPHTQHAPDAFYQALGAHWNDRTSYAAGIGHYATTGAAAAFAGMIGKHLDKSVDIEKLIKGSSIEAAAAALALKLRDGGLDDAGVDALVQSLTDHAAVNQQKTEDAALKMHSRLQMEQREISRQRDSGELRGGDTAILEQVQNGTINGSDLAKHSISIQLEADNLMRQRENLGTALGSMQATAAFIEALSRAKSANQARDYTVRISVGTNLESAKETAKALGLRSKAAAISRNADGFTVNVNTRSLGRLMTVKDRERGFADEMEAIKTDPSSTEGYEVPGWHDTFTDSKGKKHGYQWRTEQRNDIEWLRKAGGGLITRVTGAGKTNTALGYLAHQINENGNYTAMIAVPKGKASEWHGEAQMFSSLPTVHIPDDAKRSDVARILKEGGRGKIFVMSHDQASKHADLLENHDMDGAVIDEPHMLTGKGKSKKMNAGAQRIMKLGAARLKAGGTFNRVAMTATPAKDDPVNAYDLVNWVAPGKAGARTRFQRAYSGGFGAGTNAQDEAIAEQVMRDLGPYMSGERLTAPSFKTKHRLATVRRSLVQANAQRQIEQDAPGYIERKVGEALQKAGANPLTVQMHGKQWRRKISAAATEKAHDEIRAMHQANLGGGGGADNPKIQDAMHAIRNAEPGTKHVFYVDSKEQRGALVAGLRGEGYKQHQIANMAADTMSISGDELADRRAKFKNDDDVPFVIIDKSTAAGHNLQEGSHLHVLGTPTDAATYLQAQGRIAREPRKGDVQIHTYKYQDSPFESADWGNLERQLKILKATAPGLAIG